MNFKDLEYPLFHGLINKKEFKKLSTDKKIKLLLQKGVFIVRSNTCLNEIIDKGFTINKKRRFYSRENFNDLDLSGFKKAEFCINETYMLEHVHIFMNSLISSDIIYTLKSAVHLSSFTEKLENKITLDTKGSKLEKRDYLANKIKELNPLELPHLQVDLNTHSDNLFLSPGAEFHITDKNPDYVIDWITGNALIHGYNLFDYPNMKNFYKDYVKFYLSNYCLEEIRKVNIKLQGENELEDVENIVESVDLKHYTTYQQTYFLFKLGVTLDLYNNSAGSWKKTAIIISKLITRGPDNIIKYNREFNSGKTNNLSLEKQRARKKIDELIASFQKRG